jgi:hypothetical protein
MADYDITVTVPNQGPPGPPGPPGGNQEPVAFRATRDGMAEQENGGLIAWNLEFDTTGGFADNIFTVPEGLAGLYAFNSSVYYQGESDAVAIELGIYVNDSRQLAFYGAPFESGGQGQEQVFGILNLDEGDEVAINVQFFYDSGTVRSDGGVNWFVGVKL